MAYPEKDTVLSPDAQILNATEGVQMALAELGKAAMKAEADSRGAQRLARLDGVPRARSGAALGTARVPQAVNAMAAPFELLLSDRQRRVLELRIQGRGRRQIAHILGVSVWTVHADMARARETMGVSDEVELLIAYDRRGRP